MSEKHDLHTNTHKHARESCGVNGQLGGGPLEQGVWYMCVGIFSGRRCETYLTGASPVMGFELGTLGGHLRCTLFLFFFFVFLFCALSASSLKYTLPTQQHWATTFSDFTSLSQVLCISSETLTRVGPKNLR